jgi:hypothetical protein
LQHILEVSIGESVSSLIAVFVGVAKGSQGTLESDMGLGSKESWLLHPL